MAFLLALLSPLVVVGAIVLSLLLAVVVCYAAIYARLYPCCFGCQPSNSGHGDEVGQLHKAATTVNMLGMHVADLPGCDIITIKDQQNDHQQAVMQLFRVHGHRNSNFYTTFSNPEMQVLLLPGVGCMVYTVAAHWGLEVVVAIGDPMCQPQHDLLMLQTFKAVFPAGALIDVSKHVASLWVGVEAKQPGPAMTVTDMGTETIIDLQKYSFEFNKRTKEIRRNAEAATRAGLVVEEVTAHSNAAVKEQVQQLAAEWQQGKEVTHDLKVFSRIIPFQYLGREKDVRVFIARTLEPGEEASAVFTVAKATKQLEQQKAAVAAGKLAAKPAAVEPAATTEDNTKTSSSGPRSSEQQRRKRARRALVRQQQQQQQQEQCTTVADSDCAVAAAPCAAPPSSALSSADTNLPRPVIITCDTQQLSDRQRQQKEKQQQTASSTAAGGSSVSSGSSGGSASSHIHACVMLDPIYQNGEVVGYFVQRTFLSPQGVKGAPKLVLKEVLGLLKAEGRAILNHGLAPLQNVKPGKGSDVGHSVKE